MTTIPAGFGQATFTFSGSGVPNGAAVTLGFSNTTVLSAAAICTQIRLNFETNIMPPLVQNTGLLSVLVKLGPNSTGQSAVQGSTVAGSDLSAQAPANVAYLIHKTTAGGGRRGRGRMFLPGVDETDVDQTGLIAAGKITALNNAFTNFALELVADATPPFLLHEPATTWVLVNGQPRRVPTGAAPVPTAITSWATDSRVATQRRRQRR